MKIFKRSSDSGWGNKLNVIDENNVFVGFDFDKQCCEDFGYYFSKKEPPCDRDSYISEDSFDHESYVFDTSYHRYIPYSEDCGGSVCLKLISEHETDIFLVFYNFHNGYYSHGFVIKKDDVSLYSASL